MERPCGNDLVRVEAIKQIRRLIQDDNEAVSAAAKELMTALNSEQARREAEEQARREAEERVHRARLPPGPPAEQLPPRTAELRSAPVAPSWWPSGSRGEWLRRPQAMIMAALAVVVLVTLVGVVVATNSRVRDSGGASAASCVDTSGNTVKVGFLNSLSGTMAISEKTVHDSLALATEQINASGGVLGKTLQVVSEDAASEPTVFAEKATKLISSDCVAAVFGGWTSASRKAMLPVFEGANSLLFYPVQYEGLEASPNIFYTGATTNQQIVPGLDYLKQKGVKSLRLIGNSA